MTEAMSIINEFDFNNTQKTILLNLVDALKVHNLESLSIKDIADLSDISERTVFRNFHHREGLIDALAQVVVRLLDSPPTPVCIDMLLDYPKALFACFEKNIDFTQAALQPEIVHRIRGTLAAKRWQEIEKLIHRSYPGRSKSVKKMVAANIRFLLSASTWHYYRFILELSAQMTVQAVTMSVCSQLEILADS
ncbi:MAG: hypothetical protein CME71_02975 [Halobacteriovorax sp.]|nr:hypothetical protein [Halobacteriovorax sp.]|tara:strand:- start:1128 stop:1706 length:579 start_codon:yes stop_codon:yes gene_type:complete